MSTRTITVIDATVVKSGTSDSGKPWALHEITATTTEGAPIDLKLKSFEKLDGTVEVDVEKQEHEKYGTSYMLKRAGGGGGSPGARLGPKVDDLRGRIERLEGLVEALSSTVSGLQTIVGQLTRGAPPDAPAAQPYGEPPEPSRFGDDVPF